MNPVLACKINWCSPLKATGRRLSLRLVLRDLKRHFCHFLSSSGLKWYESSRDGQRPRKSPNRDNSRPQWERDSCRFRWRCFYRPMTLPFRSDWRALNEMSFVGKHFHLQIRVLTTRWVFQTNCRPQNQTEVLSTRWVLSIPVWDEWGSWKRDLSPEDEGDKLRWMLGGWLSLEL